MQDQETIETRSIAEDEEKPKSYRSILSFSGKVLHFSGNNKPVLSNDNIATHFLAMGTLNSLPLPTSSAGIQTQSNQVCFTSEPIVLSRL